MYLIINTFFSLIDAEILLQQFDEKPDEAAADQDAVDETSVPEAIDRVVVEEDSPDTGPYVEVRPPQSQVDDIEIPPQTRPEVPALPEKKAEDTKQLKPKDKLAKKDKVLPKLSKALSESKPKSKKKQKKSELKPPTPEEPSIQLTPSVSDLNSQLIWFLFNIFDLFTLPFIGC